MAEPASGVLRARGRAARSLRDGSSAALWGLHRKDYDVVGALPGSLLRTVSLNGGAYRRGFLHALRTAQRKLVS